MTATVALTLYAAIVVGLLASNYRWSQMRKAKAAAEHVNWLPFLPPVPAPLTPPFSQTVPDASWFAGMPVEILSDEAVRSLFDELIEIEGLS